MYDDSADSSESVWTRTYNYWFGDGCNGNGSRPPYPVTDPTIIHTDNVASGRPYAIQMILNDVHEQLQKKKGQNDDDDDGSSSSSSRSDNVVVDAVIIMGDFNEPSCLDWINETKDNNNNNNNTGVGGGADHNGLVYEWDSTLLLKNNGYVDSYRSIHPSPVTHPGYTWPSAAAAAATTTATKVTAASAHTDLHHHHLLSPTNWLRESDERDRIDFVFYKNLNLNSDSNRTMNNSSINDGHADDPDDDRENDQKLKEDEDEEETNQSSSSKPSSTSTVSLNSINPVRAQLVGTTYMSVRDEVIDESTMYDDEYVDLNGGTFVVVEEDEQQEQQQQQTESTSYNCSSSWWPSDHRGVLIEFETLLSNNNNNNS
jgi:hypothetical protein